MRTESSLPKLAMVFGLLAATTAHGADFGAEMQAKLEADSLKLFGFEGPLTASATEPTGYARNATEAASDLMALASGLQVEYVTRQVANKADMMDFWPYGVANPTHIITCVEGGNEFIDGANKMNPSVQSIELSTGDVKTILRGMNRCDGLRTTAWGTVLATEERTDGEAYEIADPLNLAEHTVTDRAAGTVVVGDASSTTEATKIIKRDALPMMAWEGLAVLESGVVIGGDELRPGSYEDDYLNKDTDGGAIFKFIPDMPWDGTTAVSWPNTPLASGTTYVMQVSCRDSKQQYGQGCEVGNAAWIQVDGRDARKDADRKGATGYYRPEDLHTDPTYQGPGVRFCWANTGNEGAKHYGEVICGVDAQPQVGGTGERTVVVNRFVEGDTDFTSVDNFAFQPFSGVHYGIEDHDNGDVWACLPDGADRDIKTDGCVKVLSLVDTSAEPTGFMFDPTGTTAYFFVQHSADPADGSMDHDGYPTDDLLKITGFKLPVRAQ